MCGVGVGVPGTVSVSEEKFLVHESGEGRVCKGERGAVCTVRGGAGVRARGAGRRHALHGHRTFETAVARPRGSCARFNLPQRDRN